MLLPIAPPWLPPVPTVTAVSPTSGTILGGGSVVITGTSFLWATGVSFGSTAATSFVIINDYTIIAVAPSESAATVDVTVTSAGGTSATSGADQFTFVAGPFFDNSVIAPEAVDIASGTAYTWTHQAAASTYALVCVYGWGNTGQTTLSATAAVTFGGTTMSSLGNVYCDNNSSDGWIWVFGVNGISAGSKTVSVTFTQSGDQYLGFGTSYTYQNVSSVGTLATAFGSSTSPSVSVSSGSGDVVWGTINSNTSLTTYSGFSLTTRETQTTSAPIFIAGDKTGSSTVAVSATTSPTGVWAAAGLNLL